jgi:hypothetical protein
VSAISGRSAAATGRQATPPNGRSDATARRNQASGTDAASAGIASAVISDARYGGSSGGEPSLTITLTRSP